MFSRPTFFAAFLALAAIPHPAAHAQFPTPTVPPPTGLPIKQTYLTSDDGWLSIGDGAKVSIVPNPISINSADGALRLDYTIAAGNVSAFLLPVGIGSLTGARSFRFEVRSDYAAKLVFGIQEQDGGRYLAFISLPKDKWQSVELTPADFLLAAGPNDPKDPDNKLDLDQAQFVGLVDAGALFVQANNPALNDLLGIPTGAHHLYLADFEIATMPLRGASGAPPPPDFLDAFAHPQISWLTLGSVDEKLSHGPPLPGRGLTLSYTQAPAKLSGVIHFVARGSLAGAAKLSLTVASVKAANLLIQVEDVDGNKFNTQLYVPSGAATAQTVAVSFADFKPAADAQNKTASLDLTQIDRVLIFDATGLLGNVTMPTENVLSVGDLRVVRP